MDEQAQYAAAQGDMSFDMWVILAIMVVSFASMWKLFTKAGQPGWAVLIPIYNLAVFLKVIGKPSWFVVIYIIPFIGGIFSMLTFLALARCFGKGVGFGIGLLFLPFIFLPILAFGDAQYVGPEGAPSTTAQISAA